MPTTLAPKSLTELITSTRASSASRFNEQGNFEVVAANVLRIDHDPTTKVTNLFTQSEFAGGMIAGTALRGGAVSDASMEGFAGAVRFVKSAAPAYAYKGAVTVGKTYVFSCILEMEDNLGPPIVTAAQGSQAPASDAYMMLGAAAVPTANIVVTPQGGRRYRVSGWREAASTSNNTGMVKWSENSDRAFKVTAYQLEEGTTPGRYVPTTAASASSALPLGMLMEEGRTNYILQSQDLAISPWSSWSGTRTTDATGGPGGMPCTTYVGPVTPTGAAVSQSFTYGGGTTYTFSIYVKAANGDMSTKNFLIRNYTTAVNMWNGTWNPVTGAVTGDAGWTSQHVGDGWYRLTFTGTTGVATGDVMAVYPGCSGGTRDSNYSWKVAGAQFESGATATSLIPTTTAAATRAREDAVIPVGPWFNPAEGTFVGEVLNGENVSSRIIFSSDNAGQTINRMLCYLSGGVPAFVINRDNVTQMSATVAPVAPRSIVRAALTYKTDDSAVSVNGSAPVTRTSCSLPTAITRITLGGRTAAGADQLNGHLRAFDYYPKRLPNDELKALTT